MKRKNVAIIVTAVSLMGILAGCKKSETVLPVNTPVETPIETPVEKVEQESVEIQFSEDLKLVSVSYNAENNTMDYGIENKSGFDLSYGSPYGIYKKQSDGKFIKTEHTDGLSFDMALRSVEIDGFVTETVGFNQNTKSFEDGEYHIVKEYTNGDGTQAGIFIPEVTFTIEDGKIKQTIAAELSYDYVVNYVSNFISYSIKDGGKPLSISMDVDFFVMNPESKAFSSVDLGFEKSGLYGENIVGEEYVGLIDFNEIKLDKEGLFEARVDYSVEGGATNQLKIPFAVMYNDEEVPALTVYPMAEYNLKNGIEVESVQP